VTTRDPGRVAADAGLDERIAALGQSLGAAEQQVARFFAARRDEIPFLSALDIAAALETSNATVVRAAQALGYPGLRALKDELATALRAIDKPAARIGQSLDELAPDSDKALDNVLSFDVRVLDDARQTLSAENFQTALQHLHEASRIAVIAPGFYQWIAQHMVMCLHRYGRRAFAVTARGEAIADELIRLEPGDAVLVIAYEAPIPEVLTALDHVAALGCPCILITDVLQLALAGRYTVALSAGRGGSNMLPTSVVTIAVFEALLLALAGQDPARVMHAMQDRETLRNSVHR
jgi:DNA-binding MurR/RpiR family transcriptional regulator